MAASRIVSRNARIIATNATEIAVTSRRRKAWRKRVSVIAGAAAFYATRGDDADGGEPSGIRHSSFDDPTAVVQKPTV